MSIANEIRSIAAKVEPFVAFAEVVEHVVGIGGPAGEKAVDVIRAAVKALADGQDGTLMPDEVIADLAKLRAGFAANDAAADATVAGRLGELPP